MKGLFRAIFRTLLVFGLLLLLLPVFVAAAWWWFPDYQAHLLETATENSTIQIVLDQPTRPDHIQGLRAKSLEIRDKHNKKAAYSIRFNQFHLQPEFSGQGDHFPSLLWMTLSETLTVQLAIRAETAEISLHEKGVSEPQQFLLSENRATLVCTMPLSSVSDISSRLASAFFTDVGDWFSGQFANLTSSQSATQIESAEISQSPQSSKPLYFEDYVNCTQQPLTLQIDQIALLKTQKSEKKSDQKSENAGKVDKKAQKEPKMQPIARDFSISATPKLVADEAQSITLHRVQAQTLGGWLYLEEGNIDLAEQSADLLLEAETLSMRTLADLIGNKRLAMSGAISGTVPITVRQGKISVQNGSFQSLPTPSRPARLIYATTPAEKQSAPEHLKTTYEVLSNFIFTDLSGNFEVLEDGNSTIRLMIEGANPGFRQGQSVKFNLTVRQNMYDLVRAIWFSDQLKLRLQKRVNR